MISTRNLWVVRFRAENRYAAVTAGPLVFAGNGSGDCEPKDLFHSRRMP